MPERSVRLAPLVVGLAALAAAGSAIGAAGGEARVAWVAPVLLFDVGVAVILATLVRPGDEDDGLGV